MDNLQSTIEAAAQRANLLSSSIRKAFAIAAKIDRPEGRNVYDKAITEHLSNLLEQARKLESALNQIALYGPKGTDRDGVLPEFKIPVPSGPVERW